MAPTLYITNNLLDCFCDNVTVFLITYKNIYVKLL